MEKIKLLLGAGVPYSATTPLWYTLTWDHKYCHTGHKKEPQWLDIIQKQQEQKYNLKYDRGIRFKDRRSKFTRIPYFYLGDKKPWWIQRTKFNRQEEDSYFSLPTTLEQYIDYYKKHWRDVKYEFQSVGDFSNSTCSLKKQFMLDIRDQLLEVFDIKVILIFRNPVYRLWSASKCNYEKIFCPNGKVDNWNHYAKMYTKHCEVWGKENVLPLIMERVWKDPSELSDFLGYKIEKMHENVYYPERGTKAPKLKWLPDQWAGDTSELAKEIDYESMREEFDYLYTDFEKTFGYLPEEWSP
tara:strand:- start:1625 stop:2518 length:894 start_codon:yes stop_codon:yes gene_type:complete